MRMKRRRRKSMNQFKSTIKLKKMRKPSRNCQSKTRKKRNYRMRGSRVILIYKFNKIIMNSNSKKILKRVRVNNYKNKKTNKLYGTIRNNKRVTIILYKMIKMESVITNKINLTTKPFKYNNKNRKTRWMRVMYKMYNNNNSQKKKKKMRNNKMKRKRNKKKMKNKLK